MLWLIWLYQRNHLLQLGWQEPNHEQPTPKATARDVLMWLLLCWTIMATLENPQHTCWKLLKYLASWKYWLTPQCTRLTIQGVEAMEAVILQTSTLLVLGVKPSWKFLEADKCCYRWICNPANRSEWRSEWKMSNARMVKKSKGPSFSILLPPTFSLPQEKSKASFPKPDSTATVIHPVWHLWGALQISRVIWWCRSSSSMLGLAQKAKASVKSSCRSWVARSQLEGLACKSNHREILLQEPGDRNSVLLEDEGCPEPGARVSSWLCPRSVGSPEVNHLGLLPQL